MRPEAVEAVGQPIVLAVEEDHDRRKDFFCAHLIHVLFDDPPVEPGADLRAAVGADPPDVERNKLFFSEHETHPT